MAADRGLIASATEAMRVRALGDALRPPAPPSLLRPDLPPRRSSDLPFELSVFEGVAHPALLQWAANRAAEIGTGGDEVLRVHGGFEPAYYLDRLAARLGLAKADLSQPLRLASRDLAGAISSGWLPVADGPTQFVVAPRGTAVRTLHAALKADPALASRLQLASPEALRRYCETHEAGVLGEQAAFGLARSRPEFSAASALPAAMKGGFAALIAGAVAAAVTMPATALLAAEFTFGAVFLALSGLKIAAALQGRAKAADPAVAAKKLPVYTLLVPLYREAKIASRLVAHLSALDYPPEKLDIKLIVEPDDRETRAALEQIRLARCFEIFEASGLGPRTKPKALMSALSVSRGELVAVYDAEDEPETDQLRKAAAAFAAGGASLGCVQAQLAIDNAGDNWLTRQFAAEYAGQFAVLLPVLARAGLPLPLGGTSNHFRLDALRACGGWDPFNVTEDADLGMRLARFGYRTEVIDSLTWEEAPSQPKAWLHQRRRWFKGWIQVSTDNFIIIFQWLAPISLAVATPLQQAKSVSPGERATARQIAG